jgi:hypothetical protein
MIELPAHGLPTMSSMTTQSAAAVVRSRRFAIAAILAVGLGMSLIVQTPGWAQSSYYALTRAFSNGTAQIDAYHWETGDKSWINNHFFSVKSPGLSAILLPEYELLKAVDFPQTSQTIGNRLQRDNNFGLKPGPPKTKEFGFSLKRAIHIRNVTAGYTAMLWALGLIGTVLPAILMMLMVRAIAERDEPGTGAGTALALGMGTMVLPFSTQLFGHLMATFVLFGSFMLMLRERRSAPSYRLIALAGLITGLAVVIEYPLAFGGAIIGLFAAFREEAIGLGWTAVVRRGLAYAAGVIVGVIPVGIYNVWAYGKVSTMSYINAVSVQGKTGHDIIGLVNSGFFGIGKPKPTYALDLMLSPRGMIAATPVFAMMLVGLVLMYRRGRRLESLTLLAIVGAYWFYVSGYWWPFGGQVPGPRYMIPILPFAALGLPFAWKRFPLTTLGSAVASACIMGAATLTQPLVREFGVNRWWDGISKGFFTITVPTLFGAGNGWAATAPVIASFVIGGLLAAVATTGLDFSRDRLIAVIGLFAWGLWAWFAARHLPEQMAGQHLHTSALPHRLVAGALVLSAASMLAATVIGGSRSGSGSAGEVVDDQRSSELPAHA